MRFGHNFWLGGPIDLRSTRLNCILQDLFRDTPPDHTWRTQIRAQIHQIRYLGRAFECAKYGRVGYPWKDLAKCSSVALILGQDRQTLVITVITLIWSWRVWIAMFVLLDRLTGFEDLNATPHLWTLRSTNMMLSVFSLPIILRGGLICLFIKVQSFEILSFRST